MHMHKENLHMMNAMDKRWIRSLKVVATSRFMQHWMCGHHLQLNCSV